MHIYMLLLYLFYRALYIFSSFTHINYLDHITNTLQHRYFNSTCSNLRNTIMIIQNDIIIIRTLVTSCNPKILSQLHLVKVKELPGETSNEGEQKRSGEGSDEWEGD